MHSRKRILFSALVVCLAAAQAGAQETEAAKKTDGPESEARTPQIETIQEGTTIELPVLVLTKVSTTVAVPDGGAFNSGGTIGYPDGSFKRSSGTPAKQYYHAHQDELKNRRLAWGTIPDGIKLNIIHGRQPIEMSIFDEGKIKVSMIRKFDRNNLDTLSQHHPDIYMHVSSFPASTDGKSITLNLEIESDYEFENPDDLKKRDSELYDIFVEYAEPIIANRALEKPVRFTVAPRIIIQEEEEETPILKNESDKD